MIDQGNHKLATIIAVHQANAVCQGNAMLGRQTGTGENTDGNILPGRRNGKSGRDFGNFTRGNGKWLVQASVQVAAGAVFRSTQRQLCGRMQFLNR